LSLAAAFLTTHITTQEKLHFSWSILKTKDSPSKLIHNQSITIQLNNMAILIKNNKKTVIATTL